MTSLDTLYEQIIERAVRVSYGQPHGESRRTMGEANRRWRATIAAYARHHPEELARFRRNIAAESRQTVTVVE